MSAFFSKVELVAGHVNVELHNDFNYITGFELINFQKSFEYYFKSEKNEIGLLLVKGTCNITINGQEYKELGMREDAFSGLPTGVYIPIHSKFSIKSENALVAVCKTRCSIESEPAIIYPENVKVMNVGKDNWNREVRLIIGPDSPSVNLILGETINPPGNWSGTPPAKHENNNFPIESLHEELYYFKTDKSQGWGIERIYSKERNINELIYIEDNVVTYIPWGYHQVASAPGYTLYYLFFLAGENKKLTQFEDPEHNWIKFT